MSPPRNTHTATTANVGADTAGDDAHYLALQARDARFDGRFFTGVTSTGIYCRPVCKVRTPRRENCRFFALAAQAEREGFRPCLRCRPELAPRGDAIDRLLSELSDGRTATMGTVKCEGGDNWRFTMAPPRRN